MSRARPFTSLGSGVLVRASLQARQTTTRAAFATYSQAGAQFGVNMLWTVVVTFPLMAAIQAICARIGRVTGEGLAANMARVLPRPLVYVIVFLLFLANTVNIGADIVAMGAAVRLVFGLGRDVFRGPVCGGLAASAGSRALSPLRACAEMADARLVR
ncbi:MAG TPA: divalent metal cation transporter, partial [Acidobacteriaceae bacterium]